MTNKENIVKITLNISIYTKIFFLAFFLWFDIYILACHAFITLLVNFAMLNCYKKGKYLNAIPITILLDFFTVPMVCAFAFGPLFNPLVLHVSYFPLIFLLIDIRKKNTLLILFVVNLIFGLITDSLVFLIGDDYIMYSLSENQLFFVRNNLFLVIGCGLSYNVYLLLKQNRKTEHQLQIALHELKKAYDAKSEFLSIMSHEIRTPLNGIIGLSDLVSAKDENLDENISVLKSSAKRLLVLVNDILDYSKLESGKITLKEEVFNLEKEIKEIESSLAFRAKEKNIMFSVVLDDDVPVSLMGDANRLSQVLINLLDNALKFTYQGSVSLHISCPSIKDNKAQLLFHIKDTGIGIPEDQQGNMFDKFTQAEYKSTRKHGGTGLGLSIVKKIVELQDGFINMKSTQGKGTSFFIELEYAVANATEEDFTETTIKLHPDFNISKVLLVEDNEMNQFVFQQMFKSYDIPFSICANGAEALERTENEEFSIILMDYHMPDMNGVDVIRSIKNNKKNFSNKACFYLLTADALTSFEDEKRELNLVSVLRKPISRKTLLYCLNDCIKRRAENNLN